MKIYTTLFVGSCVLVSSIQSMYAELKDDLLNGIGKKSIGTGDMSTAKGTDLLDKILDFVKDSIFGLLGLISVAMFLYVGFRLIKAEGNPEEMKAAFKTLTYVVVGLFIVAISWAAIKIISGLNF